MTEPVEHSVDTGSTAQTALEIHGVTAELHPKTRPAAAAQTTLPVATTATVTIGSVLRERYVIKDLIGTGGRGRVFRALDRYRSSLPDGQRYVALKVLDAGPDQAEQTMNDLRRELHCAQLLSHRNIVNVFEMDRDGDIVFFTMELLDGELLSDVIKRTRSAGIQRNQAWQIIRQLGAGLDHAHEHGIVHGDLKPGNLFITQEGELRILDFGTAQRIISLPPDRGQPSTLPLYGTPAYASCELLEGRIADTRDDVYSAACICYELLTGTHPFARRPATQARDLGVRATRPAGLSARQWKALQGGLSWHRAGRSMGVSTFFGRLTHGVPMKSSLTALADIAMATAPKPSWAPRAVAAGLAILLMGGVGVSRLRGVPAPINEANAGLPPSAPPVVSEPLEATVLPSDTVKMAAPAAVPPAVDVQPSGPIAKSPGRPERLKISVDGYHVSSDDHFVEVRVRRNQVENGASFSWWTENATARQNVDFVHQGKAIQTFPRDGRSTRFYVKLLTESGRSQRSYFYVAIAQPGVHHPEEITRVQIWLPVVRGQLQASR